MLFGPLKEKLKERAEAEFVPSPSHICNTSVVCSQEAVSKVNFAAASYFMECYIFD